MQNRLSKLTQDSGVAISENLLLSCDIPRLDKGGLEVIAKWIEDNPDTRLIVVDTLGRFDAEADKHSTAYASDTRSLAPLQKLAITKQIAVLLITHLTKRSSDDPLARVMGSTGVIGVADAVWLLERERGAQRGMLSVTGRDVLEQKLAIDFNDGQWAILGDAARYQLSEERLAIREYLEQSDTPVGVREIASAIDKRESAVKSLLYKMLKDAQIRKTKRGLYAAVDINEVFADV